MNKLEVFLLGLALAIPVTLLAILMYVVGRSN